MNSRSFRLLAAALMGVVFVCGFLSGRLTAPPTVVVEPTTVGDSESKVVRNVNRRVMSRYAEDLELAPEQLRLLRPMFEATGERMQGIPKDSEARLQELRRFHEEMSPHLTEEQRGKAREILEQALRTKRKVIESSAD